MSRKVIDFRVRPPYKSYQAFVDGLQEQGFINHGFEYRGSIKTKKFDDFIQELHDSGVEKAVIQGRHGMGMYVDNAELFELVDQYPDLFIAYPFIDPLEGQKALDDVDELVINGKGKGVALEPGFPEAGKPGYKFDDERVYPLYKKLEENNIPILLTYSAFALETFDVDSPRQLDRVARDFPNLVIVVAHGGWPWVREAVAIALQHRNIYLAPDIYGTKGPGAQDYAIAAQTVLRNQIIFESSYPIIPVDQTIEQIEKEWGLDEEALNNVLYANAAKVLGL